MAELGGTAAGAPGDDGYKWRAFVAIAVAFVTMVMSMSMVFVALASIAEEFDVTLRAVSWVVIVQALTITALMLPMGRLADLVGRRRVHLTGTVLFAVGCVCCAVAPSLAALLAARVVMSVGSAMGQSVGSAMVVSVFPPEERGRAVGSQTTAVAVGAALGPVLAGFTLQFMSWRWLFVVVALPMVVAFVWGRRVLDEARVTPDNANGQLPFDGVGATLSALAVVAVVVTTSNPLALEWTSPGILGGAAVSVLLLVAFVMWERRTPHPMLDLRTFGDPLLSGAVAIRLVGFMASTVILLLLPVFLISYRGIGEGLAGTIMFLSAVGLGTASQVTGRLSDRFGERPFLLLGFSGCVLTAATLSFVDAGTPLGYLVVVVFLNGLFQGAWSVPNNSLIMGAVPRSMLGVAGALSNLTRNVGNVLGQALAAAIVAAVMVSRGFDIALDEIPETPGAGDAFLEGWQQALAFTVALAVVGLVISIALRRRPAAVEVGSEPAAASAPTAIS